MEQCVSHILLARSSRLPLAAASTVEYFLYLIDMSKLVDNKLKTLPLNPADELQLRYSQTHIMSNSVNLG